MCTSPFQSNFYGIIENEFININIKYLRNKNMQNQHNTYLINFKMINFMKNIKNNIRHFTHIESDKNYW